MLIVIEGLDGSGKSTQVKRIRSYLESISPKVRYIHFPRYEAPLYGDLVGSFLKGKFGSINQVHPQIVALLFALDRQDAAPLIRKSLDEGSIVLLDRYVYSNIAYQCAKLSDKQEKEELRKWIFDTEYGFYCLPKPDINIFLDVPTSFVEHNLTSAREGADRQYLDEGSKDIHESSMDFQKAVREMYVGECSADPDFIRVDCSDKDGKMLPADEIFIRIKAVIDEKLNK